ncbi:hypothetical protein OG21DRAFT_1488050 [Imleria badia]|nr:hypothetical protein OG21DRAFT_1488050 [Imleria badia]
MHHALEIQEILLNIFQHCYSPGRWKDTTSDLASLARTCRAFREPALDVLWEDLDDLSPLAQCLPDASRQLSRDKYAFSRPLTQTEWDILRSYTRRIQSIQVFDDGLDWESVATFFNPPTTMPLFPNLRNLSCKYTAKSMPLLHLPLPSLLCLNVEFENPHLFQNSLNSFPHFSPNIRILRIWVLRLGDTYSKPISNGIYQWRNLQTLIFPYIYISLDVDALVHLSCMPALTQLEFTPSATLPISDSRLFFSNLRDMTPRSESLHPISRLLSQTQLPVITTFTAFISSSPSRLDLTSFFAGVQISSSGCTMERLTLDQTNIIFRSEAHLPCLEHLRPWSSAISVI